MENRNKIIVKSIAETVALINDNAASLVRFGDGEVDIMNGHGIPYQMYNEQLALKLKEILHVQSDGEFLVGIPDVFHNLERYNDAAQNFWKNHLEIYKGFYGSALTSKWYVTTFVSRPYIDLINKEEATTSFQKIKSLWDKKDILIVEGSTSRSGVGNDLFHNTSSISRIICPSHHSFVKHEQILESIREHGKGKLILLMLGPTAKVIAYECYKEGYQALDIGHIDSEYEWFQRGATHKIKLNHKHTAEFNFDENIIFEKDLAYEQSIVSRID